MPIVVTRWNCKECHEAQVGHGEGDFITVKGGQLANRSLGLGFVCY
jgi:hypothetical protein